MDTRIAAFLAKAKALPPTPSAIEALCAEELAFIQQTYKTTDNSRSGLVRCSAYRKAIVSSDLDAHFLASFRWDTETTAALNDAALARTIDRTRHQRDIEDYKALIAKAQWCVQQDSWTVVLVGLKLLSGRRAIELCVTGDFSLDDALEPPLVLFSGIAKGRSIESRQEQVTIPLLIDREQFLAAWLRFTRMKDFSDCDHTRYDDPEDTARYDPFLAEEAKKKFKNTGSGINKSYRRHFVETGLMPHGTTSHALRSVYALICLYMFAPSDQDETTYIADTLRHTKDRLGSVPNYKKYRLAEFPRARATA